MSVRRDTGAAAGDGTEQVRAWLQGNLGGRVVRIGRQARWRPVWFADVERDGETLELCVRGDRTDMPLIFPLDHEMRLQALMHDHGIPTPKVHGWIDEPTAYVMDRVPGRSDFTQSTDEERAAVVDDYLQILARLHALDIGPFVDGGIMRAARPEESGTFGMSRYERVFRIVKDHPDPFVEFCLGWLRRNPPDSRGRESAIVWDSGQFHHQGGRVVAVLDVEIGHIGDPMMDLAAWRMRDTVIGFGDVPRAVRPLQRAHRRTRRPRRDPAAPLRVHAHQPAPDGRRPAQPTAGIGCHDQHAVVLRDEPVRDRGVGGAARRRAADRRDAGAAVVARRRRRSGTSSPTSATVATDDEYLRYKLRTLFRTARHIARADEIGDRVSEDDLDDLHELLGHRPGSWLEGEAELERFVLADADTGRHDEALVQVFHKRNLRAQMLLGPAGSAMARHLTIQTFLS